MHRTWVAVHSKSACCHPSQFHPRWSTEYHKDWILDRSFLSCTLLTRCSWYNLTNFIHMRMPTTVSSTDIVDHPVPQVWLMGYLAALTTCRCGWGQTDCNSTLPRQRFFGVRQYQIPTGSVRIGNANITPVSSVRYLGVHIDSDVTLRSHASSTVLLACFTALRVTLIGACGVLCHLKPFWLWSELWLSARSTNSNLVGVSGHLLDRLQSVLNAAARLVFLARQSDHVSPLLCELYTGCEF